MEHHSTLSNLVLDFRLDNLDTTLVTETECVSYRFFCVNGVKGLNLNDQIDAVPVSSHVPILAHMLFTYNVPPAGFEPAMMVS